MVNGLSVTVLTNSGYRCDDIPFDMVVIVGSNPLARFTTRFGISVESSGVSRDDYKNWDTFQKAYTRMYDNYALYRKLYCGWQTLVMLPGGSWSLSNVREEASPNEHKAS